MNPATNRRPLLPHAQLLDAEAIQLFEQTNVNRIDPFGAALHDLPRQKRCPHRPHSPTRAISTLDQVDLAASGQQHLGGTQTGKAGTDDNDSHEELSAAGHHRGDLPR